MARINLRPSLAQHLQQRLQAFHEGFRRNLALIGPPGSGKTFQLQQIIARHPSGTLLIYCPVYRESCRTFLRRLMCAILQAGLRVSDAQPLDVLLQRAETELPKTVGGLRVVEGLLSRRAYGDAFNRTLDAIPMMSEERRQPCILMLDEFLFLEELGLVHAFHELGKRVMTWPSILFVLASSSPCRARRILRERLQLLFGQFELLTLDGLDGQRTSAWVRQELKGLRGLRSVGPFLIWWLNAQPWYLTVMLKRLRELATLQQASEVTEALFLQSAWDVLGSTEGPLHQWSVSRLEPVAHVRHGARAIEALLEIADGARTATDIGRRIGRAGLSGALDVLVSHDLAQRNGMCWVIPDPLLRCWVSTILWAQRGDVPLDQRLVRQRFEHYLQSLWNQWIHLQQQSLPEQVTGLFAQFCDETVSLDQKTGRLPRFHRIETQSPEGNDGTYVVAEGRGKQWCCSVVESAVTEQDIALFEAFCRRQTPKPSRKVIVAKEGLDENAKLLAKAANMWVWGARELEVLRELYGHVSLRDDPACAPALSTSLRDSKCT